MLQMEAEKAAKAAAKKKRGDKTAPIEESDVEDDEEGAEGPEMEQEEAKMAGDGMGEEMEIAPITTTEKARPKTTRKPSNKVIPTATASLAPTGTPAGPRRGSE
jgi:hypothetical protein